MLKLWSPNNSYATTEHLVDEWKADAISGECHACGVVHMVDQVVNGALRVHMRR